MNSSLLDHSGIWWIVAEIRSSFNNCLSFSSAGFSKPAEFILKLLKSLLCSLKSYLHIYSYNLRILAYLCRSPSFDSHKKTRNCSFFHFDNILMMQANCNMKRDTFENGSLFDGLNTFTGHTSMY